MEDRDLADDPYCSVDDVIAEDLPGYYECSNHGHCDSVEGFFYVFFIFIYLYFVLFLFY